MYATRLFRLNMERIDNHLIIWIFLLMLYLLLVYVKSGIGLALNACQPQTMKFQSVFERKDRGLRLVFTSSFFVNSKNIHTFTDINYI